MSTETLSARGVARGNRHASGGLTLVELAVTVAVLAILSAFAVPVMTDMVASNRITSQTNEFVAAMSAAKSEAITRGQTVSLRAVDDANPNDFHRGWTSFVDADNDGDRDSEDLILRENGAIVGSTTIQRVTRSGTTFPSATSSLTSRQYVAFNSRGNLSAGEALFKICDSTRPQVSGRIMRVSNIGRVSIESTTENCS